MSNYFVKWSHRGLCLALLLVAGCSLAQLEDAVPTDVESVGQTPAAIVQDALVTANRDTYVRELLPFGNLGGETSFRVQGLERQRGIVQFDQAALVAAAAGRPVVEASLELTVQDTSWIWGQISAHRMKTASTELGATWVCANDANSSTSASSCTSANAWSMSSLSSSNLPYVASASATAGINAGATVVRFNVTSDVQAFLNGSQQNRGWLLKVVIEGVPGVVRFRSRESAQPPRLVLDLGAPACTPTASTDTTCNGVDDDCSGSADEDFVASASSCGVGACAATGTRSCVAGAIVNSCSPGAPAASDASCDGVDDDCSGSADEDFVSGVISCGTGGCAAVGLRLCNAGTLVDACVPLVATTEASCEGVDDDCNRCDGEDDDCDGAVDEDFVSDATSCGYDACGSTGATSCVEGELVDSCMASCEADCGDGRDEDHDGAEDCDDTECEGAPVCLPGGLRVGERCTSNEDCGEGGTCELGFPGGYCFVPCASELANGGCAPGDVCWLGSSCVVPCGESGECEDPDHACAGLQDLGLPPDPMCRPTCALSCPEPFTCDPVSSICQ